MTAGTPAPAVLEEIRAGLVAASLRGVIDNVGVDLVEQLVAAGLWPVDRGPKHTARRSAPDQRLAGLLRLVPHVEPTGRADVAARILAAAILAAPTHGATTEAGTSATPWRTRSARWPGCCDSWVKATTVHHARPIPSGPLLGAAVVVQDRQYRGPLTTCARRACTDAAATPGPEPVRFALTVLRAALDAPHRRDALAVIAGLTPVLVLLTDAQSLLDTVEAVCAELP